MEVEVGCGKWREAQCGSGGGYGWKAVADSAAEAVAVRDGPSLHRPARRSRGREGVQIWLVSHPNGGRRRRWREAERKGRRKEKKWVYVGVRKGYPRFGGEGGKGVKEGRRRRSGKGETREKQLGWLDVGRRRRERCRVRVYSLYCGKWKGGGRSV